MALHEITPPTSMTSSLDYMNTITNQWFGGFLIMFVFFVIFTSLKLYNTEKAFLSASIISFISSVLLTTAGLVTPILIPITLVMTLAGLFINT